MTNPIGVLGLGETGRAVVVALQKRGHPVVAVDDHPDKVVAQWAKEVQVDLTPTQSFEEWVGLLKKCDEMVVSPGVPDSHPVFSAALRLGLTTIDESDLAARWDTRPWCAVTGTNGKTTVVVLVTRMLERSGLKVVAAGNTEQPLIAAIDDTDADAFVIEASSFRLAHARAFRSSPAVWLNFAPDHLDHHSGVEAYRLAKTRVWEGISDPTQAIANMADPVVSRCAPSGATGFGSHDSTCRIANGGLWFEGEKVTSVADIGRRMPHDLLNAQAATATALRFGARVEACAQVLHEFDGLPHRMSVVADLGGICFIDDSKATTPHATLAATDGRPGSVLIAGGRNKGLDLSSLAEARVRAVVGIGETAPEIADLFEHRCPVRIAKSMVEAVKAAAEYALSERAGTVLLSPGCTSFDWYDCYQQRGEDFIRAVSEVMD